MKHSLTLLATLLFAPLGSLHAADALSRSETQTAKGKPDIIFVLFDDLGYGQPKCYREGTEFTTPNLDRLAKEGMRFTDAHSAASVCTPTRYGVLTGRYPSRIGQYGVLTTYSPPIIPKTRLTVASLLKQNCYDTACIGKWHLGMDLGGQPGSEKTIPIGTQLVSSPNAAGFDYFFGFTHARNIGTVIEQDKVAANAEEVETQPLLAKKVVAFLDHPTRKEKPFFLYLPICPPHKPLPLGNRRCLRPYFSNGSTYDADFLLREIDDSAWEQLNLLVEQWRELVQDIVTNEYWPGGRANERLILR